VLGLWGLRSIRCLIVCCGLCVVGTYLLVCRVGVVWLVWGWGGVILVWFVVCVDR